MILTTFHIQAQIKVAQSGRVGVGTTSPFAQFQVKGNSLFSSLTTEPSSAAFIRGNNNYSSATTPDYTWYDNDQTGLFHPVNNCIAFTTNGKEKLRIHSNGYIGINNTSPTYRLDLQGDMRFNNWTDVYVNWTGSSGSAIIYPERDWYLHLGKRGKRLGDGYFYALYTYYFTEEAEPESKSSSTFITNSVEKLKNLNGVKYTLDDSLFAGCPPNVQQQMKKERFGFKASEVAAHFPEIVLIDDSTGTTYVSYQRLVPVLVEAIKTQQEQIDYLYSVIKGNQYKTGENNNGFKNNDEIKATLFQNKPNPFNQETTIEYIIPVNTDNAVIYVFNMQGTLKKSIPLTVTGKGSISINSSELEAGMYLYSLVVNNAEADMKKMILTR